MDIGFCRNRVHQLVRHGAISFNRRTPAIWTHQRIYGLIHLERFHRSVPDLGWMNRRIVLAALARWIVFTPLLLVHYSNEVRVCDINCHWDCGIVNHSGYSGIERIQVAVPDIAGHAAIALPGLAKRGVMLPLASAAGCGFALYHSRIEVDVLGVWCLCCVVSRFMIALICGLAVTVWFRSVLARRREIGTSEFTKPDLRMVRSQPWPHNEDAPEGLFHSVRLHRYVARSGVPNDTARSMASSA